MTTLRILTLNCWGVFIPGAVKYRRQRIEAIGEEVAKQNYDIVVFCEVWLKTDYQLLCQRLWTNLPHFHYFYSGTIGSGICIFSKYPIVETIYHRYSLNGFAHKPYHGDWFGGKGVGLCKLDINGLKVNLYSSHIHAEYTQDNDEYLAHRVSQTFELSQFIKMTSNSCDLVLLGGDLNIEPVNLGYKIIRTNANLNDSWLDKKRTNGYEHGNTCDVPTNSFCTMLPGYPDGKRIDYWMYRPNKGWSVDIGECSVIMHGIPDRKYNFSDHEAIYVTLRIEPGNSEESKDDKQLRLQDRDAHLCKALVELEKGQKQTEGDKTFYQVQVLILCVLYYLLDISASLATSNPIPSILFIVKLLIIMGIIFCAWTGFIVKRIEVHSFQGVLADMSNMLEHSEVKKLQSAKD